MLRESICKKVVIVFSLFYCYRNSVETNDTWGTQITHDGAACTHKGHILLVVAPAGRPSIIIAFRSSVLANH